MNVKRCDRCGAIYENDFAKNTMGTNFLLLTDERINPVLFPQKVCFMLEGAPARTLDICPVCAEDFKKWFERMGKRVTEA